MEAFLIDYKGNLTELPAFLSWEMSYGCGVPCDAFRVSFDYSSEMYDILEDAVRFKAVFQGETVFFGVVDEYELTAGEQQGFTVDIKGRGMAAVLLDNEAEAAEYFSVGLDVILNTYVRPLGIMDIRQNVRAAPLALSVESGESCWRVLENYLWFGCGERPRFGRDGTLILGQEKGSSFVLDSETAAFAQRYRYKRYGVISKVLVKNKALGTGKTVDNTEFLNRGGSCRRVVNVPRKTRFDAMRATGEYQLSQSQKEERTFIYSVPRLFAAFPGDRVELKYNRLGLSGVFHVKEARCYADGWDAGTEITLVKGEK